jgi:cbb3-type cytochrome oxidase maturation protein
MSVFIILIIASLCVAGTFLVAFLWSVRTGQFDDDYTPSVRMLFDDPPPATTAAPDQANIQTNP